MEQDLERRSKGKAGKFIKRAFICLLAAGCIFGVLTAMWWYGFFLPTWIDWQELETDYEGGYVVLKDRKLTLYSDESCTEALWSTEKDWFVQDLVIKDMNRDGIEELVALVWKHGSYGKHMPFWETKNDKRLMQHIFIFTYEEKRDSKIRNLWMSSEIAKDLTGIASGRKDRLILSRQNGDVKIWRWMDFGLKSAEPPKESKISILCAGDNLIHLPLLGSDRSHVGLYEDVAPMIQEADIAAVNLETILVDKPDLVSDYPKFGTPMVIGEELVEAGFDVVNLANNHVLDKNTYGVNNTIGFFTEKEIPTFGACSEEEYTDDLKDRVIFTESQGIKVAFLGFTYGTNGLPMPKDCPHLVEKFEDRERLVRELDFARARADVVVVYAHWGEEYTTYPTAEQRELARLFADHHVDVVIGSHPHVLQECEVLKDGDHETYVYYSLGNFVHHQDKEGTKVGGLAKFSVTKSEDGTVTIGDYDLIRVEPVKTDAGYRVREVE